MRADRESERRRAGFGLAVLVGVFLAFPAAAWVLPAFGVLAGFIVLGLVVAAPVFLLLFRSLGGSPVPSGAACQGGGDAKPRCGASAQAAMSAASRTTEETT
jgi:hypothetical protein